MVQMAWTEDNDENNGREKKMVGENGFLIVSEPSPAGSGDDCALDPDSEANERGTSPVAGHRERQLGGSG